MDKSFDPNKILFNGSVYIFKDIKWIVTTRSKYVILYKVIDNNTIQFLLSKDFIHKDNNYYPLVKQIFSNNNQDFLNWNYTIANYFDSMKQNGYRKRNIGELVVFEKSIDLNSKNKIIKSLSKRLLELVSNCDKFNEYDYIRKLCEYSSNWLINEHDLYQLSVDLRNIILNNWSIIFDKQSDEFDSSSPEQDLIYLLKYSDSKTINTPVKTLNYNKNT